MDSVPHQEIRKKAEAYDDTLLATDPRFRRHVALNHADGSRLYFTSAFLMWVDGDWIACFTEHHGVHVYHTSDLVSYWQAERSYAALDVLP